MKPPLSLPFQSNGSVVTNDLNEKFQITIDQRDLLGTIKQSPKKITRSNSALNLFQQAQTFTYPLPNIEEEVSPEKVDFSEPKRDAMTTKRLIERSSKQITSELPRQDTSEEEYKGEEQRPITPPTAKEVSKEIKDKLTANQALSLTKKQLEKKMESAFDKFSFTLAKTIAKQEVIGDEQKSLSSENELIQPPRNT